MVMSTPSISWHIVAAGASAGSLLFFLRKTTRSSWNSLEQAMSEQEQFSGMIYLARCVAEKSGECP